MAVVRLAVLDEPALPGPMSDLDPMSSDILATSITHAHVDTVPRSTTRERSGHFDPTAVPGKISGRQHQPPLTLAGDRARR